MLHTKPRTAIEYTVSLRLLRLQVTAGGVCLSLDNSACLTFARHEPASIYCDI